MASESIFAHGGWVTEPVFAPNTAATSSGTAAKTPSASDACIATPMLGAMVIVLTESTPSPFVSVAETAILEAVKGPPRYAARLVAYVLGL